MENNENKEFGMKYKIFKDFGIQFDEKNNTYGTIRLAQWYKVGSEPDESKAKLEIRKMRMQGEEEQPGKGYSFSTPEGPHELTEGMLSLGYGDTKKCIRTLSKRDDFKESVETINEDDIDDNDSGEMFDMRSLLLGIDNGNDEED